jgi:hypothetical protein
VIPGAPDAMGAGGADLPDRTRRFLTNLRDVPVVSGLRRDEGWVDMRVQFLIDRATAGTDDMLLGWTVLPPGARHDRHLHRHADEFWIVLAGSGRMYTDEDVVLVWGWSGAGSLDDSGYEVHEEVGRDGDG